MRHKIQACGSNDSDLKEGLPKQLDRTPCLEKISHPKWVAA